MGVLHTPSRHTFECDGTQRVFPIPSFIISHDFVRIEIDGDLQSDRKQWDIVNNSLVFVVAPIEGAILDVQVASDSEALGELGSLSNIDIVAQNIDNVNATGSNIEAVINVSNNLNIVSEGFEEVRTVAENILDVKTVAENILDVNAVAYNITTITENIDAIKGASDNAITTEQNKYLAEAEALTAKSYAVEGEDLQAKKFISNGDGSFSEYLTGEFSSYHYSLKAKGSELNATNKANEVSLMTDEVVETRDIIEDIEQHIIEKTQEAIRASEEAKQSAIIASSIGNIDWAGFSVVDGELLVTYTDGLTSTPTLVDGEFIITY